jgi:hypothetical protein
MTFTDDVSAIPKILPVSALRGSNKSDRVDLVPAHPMMRRRVCPTQYDSVSSTHGRSILRVPAREFLGESGIRPIVISKVPARDQIAKNRAWVTVPT